MVVGLPVLTNARPHGGAPPPAPAPVRGERRLIDSHGRTIRDLRLSITDRCNFRCVYCMDPGVRFLPRDDLLTVEQIIRVARVCVGLGVDKLRLTGGEPTVHPGLTRIIRGLAGLGARDVALTTNGARLTDANLARWKSAGLGRVTVSLDSLRPERFRAITRSRTTPDEVIGGVRRVIRAGFEPPKLNAVVVRGVNDDEVADLAGLARELALEFRFIEFMPLDSARAWDRTKVVSADEILERIARVYPLVPLGRVEHSGTAEEYGFADGAPGRVGVIAPVTRPFCGACSRLRITADGKVRPCLFSTREWDLKRLLDAEADDRAIEDFLLDATWIKQAGHGISSESFVRPHRPMSAIGG